MKNGLQGLLNTRQAANYLGVSVAWLERERWVAGRVPFVRVGNRAVRYKLEDLDQYVERRTMRSTADISCG